MTNYMDAHLDYPQPAAKVFAVNPNDPPRAWWPLSRLFPTIPSKWATVRVDAFISELGERKKSEIYGYILMACVPSQVGFLCAIYERHFPDEDVQAAFRSLVKHGRLPDVIDPNNPVSKLLFEAAYNGVMEAREKL